MKPRVSPRLRGNLEFTRLLYQIVFNGRAAKNEQQDRVRLRFRNSAFQEFTAPLARGVLKQRIYFPVELRLAGNTRVARADRAIASHQHGGRQTEQRPEGFLHILAVLAD